MLIKVIIKVAVLQVVLMDDSLHSQCLREESDVSCQELPPALHTTLLYTTLLYSALHDATKGYLVVVVVVVVIVEGTIVDELLLESNELLAT